MNYPEPVIPMLFSLSLKLENKTSLEAFEILIETFCKDCPFPMPVKDLFQHYAKNSELDTSLFAMQNSQNELNDPQLKSPIKSKGTAAYRCDQIGSTVTITASGTLPKPEMGVRLEQLPLLIYPPQFGLFFYEPRLANISDQDFPATITLHSQARLEKIVVHDAAGSHIVDVENF